MGALLDRLRGRPRLDPTRIRTVWNCHIGTHEEYFYRVLLNVVRRDDGMHEILMPKQYTKNDDEREFVLRLLASRFVSFFHGIIMEEQLTNLHKLKDSCYKLGQQHTGYSKKIFKLVYWDVFCLAMLEELENRGGVPREELRAWQTLLHIINENMLAGYLDAKQEGRE
ncbi:hypothetical protein Angca_000494 [Angiostrongylus cantonensis]|nr:hypothetical protein Angca_000494 [Angiostrongylus cantonensis]